MKKLLMVCAIVLLFGAGTALAQPTYRFAEAGTKNFFDSETTITQGDQISLDLYLTDVGAPQNAGGGWIDFSASLAGISYVSGGRCLAGGAEGCTGPWLPGTGLYLNEPLGEVGNVLYQVANLGGAVPDADGDLIFGTLTLECIAPGDVTVTLRTDPRISFWTPIPDADVVPGSLLIHQTGQVCISDDQCDDELFCNGVETCVGGSCQDGPDPDCDDGVGCTDDFCDEVNDVCANNPNDGNCDDDDFCNGVETCDPVDGCQAGIDPERDTICDDLLWCNGEELCLGAPFNRCEPSSGNPCQGTGGSERCDEERDRCKDAPPGPTTCINNTDCSDGIFCNGEELCVFSDVSDADSSLYTWSSSFAAATGNTGTRLGTCQESEGPACPDDGDFCNGSESCDEDTAACLSSGDPCEEDDLVCDEETDACVEPAPCNDGTDCDDALFCNGRELCVDGLCQAGGDPCPPPLECDEENDQCLIVPGPGPGPGTLEFILLPQSWTRTLIPIRFAMVIMSTDDATTFDQETTTVSFSDDAPLSPPQTRVLTKKLIVVRTVIAPAGMGSNGTTEVAVTVTTPEGEGTEILTLTLWPPFLSQ